MSNAMGIAAHGNRGQQFTVGNISNGLIYLRYRSHSYIFPMSTHIGLGEGPAFLQISWAHWDGLFYRGGFEWNDSREYFFLLICSGLLK